jgi:hypothetical protein
MGSMVSGNQAGAKHAFGRFMQTFLRPSVLQQIRHSLGLCKSAMTFITRKFTAQESSLLNLGALGIPVAIIPREAGALYAVDESSNAIFVPLEAEFIGGPDGYANDQYALIYQREAFLFVMWENRLVVRRRPDLPQQHVALIEGIAHEAYLALNKEVEAPKIVLDEK